MGRGQAREHAETARVEAEERAREAVRRAAEQVISLLLTLTLSRHCPHLSSFISSSHPTSSFHPTLTYLIPSRLTSSHFLLYNPRDVRNKNNQLTPLLSSHLLSSYHRVIYLSLQAVAAAIEAEHLAVEAARAAIVAVAAAEGQGLGPGGSPGPLSDGIGTRKAMTLTPSSSSSSKPSSLPPPPSSSSSSSYTISHQVPPHPPSSPPSSLATAMLVASATHGNNHHDRLDGSADNDNNTHGDDNDGQVATYPTPLPIVLSPCFFLCPYSTSCYRHYI